MQIPHASSRQARACLRGTAIVALIALTACGGSGGSGGSGTGPPPPSTIGGNVTGLSGTVVLQNNGGNNLSVSANGPFAFGATVSSGGNYQVTVLAQPDGQRCSVAGGAGVASGSAVTVTVSCSYDVALALPLLRIATQNGVAITSKEDYVLGDFELLDADGQRQAAGTLEIRGRGNSTWNYPKKPYRVKLTSSTALLGMPANRHWVLLANYLDKTLVRTEVAFEMSRRAGLAWTPRSVQVVVELNGEYSGVYMLTEHVRIGSQRVAIPELGQGDTDPNAITGGYLMEVDHWQGEDYCRRTNRGVWLCFANPETLLEPGWVQQRAYIDDYIDALENALYGPQFADPATGYAAYIDVDSAVDFYLVHELFKNVDSNFFSSVFMYKKRGGKLTFGPVWDFDLAAGNAQWARFGFYDGADPTGWHTRRQDTRTANTSTNWYARLFADPAFAQKVRTRWVELKDAGAIDGLLDFVDRRAAWLSLVQVRNFERWPVLDTVLTPDLSPVLGPYPLHVDAMKSWLRARIDWIDAQLR